MKYLVTVQDAEHSARQRSNLRSRGDGASPSRWRYLPSSLVLAGLLLGCTCSQSSIHRPADGSDNYADGSSQHADAHSGLRWDAHLPLRYDATFVPTAEVCDHLDNDFNGIIDDVDEGSDGICDCLAVATLGVPGTWGEGDVFASWLESRSNFGVVNLTDQVLTAALLEPYQVIVVQDIRGRSYSDGEVAALEGWIRAGGGLFTLIGYSQTSDEITNVNRLLAPTGIRYGSTPVLAGTPTNPVTTWHEHPISEMIMRVGVDNGYAVEGTPMSVAEEGAVVVLRVTQLGSGKVLSWGDEWITYNSEWTQHPDYQVERFWLNAFKWLTPSDMCQVIIPI